MIHFSLFYQQNLTSNIDLGELGTCNKIKCISYQCNNYLKEHKISIDIIMNEETKGVLVNLTAIKVQ